ncbi:MAG: nucleotidyltransferase family protein [Coleofasciculus sp. B1-GNL1-01]|uniref:nucleotidyltransferase family protein n=1 Tax=Coleofasciculus sp. B1-GNL1-01 TaxID=3068484 RepID=UPI0032F39F20
MKTFTEVKDIFREYKPILLQKYNWLSELGIFGSYVRGEQNEESDIDVLIDYTEAPDLIELIDFEYYLSDNLGIKVDVVTKNGLKPRLKERILSEVVYV